MPTTMRTRHKLMSAATALAAVAMLCQCQEQPYPVYFLTEADNSVEGSRFLVYHNGRYYVRQPIITHNEIAKFQSNIAPDGSYGVSFKLKDDYKLRLYQHTQANIGKRMLPMVNAMAFSPMLINAPVTDGVLCIWNGLNGYDLRRLSNKIEPVNEKMEKTRYLKENPRRVPFMPTDTTKEKDSQGRTFRSI